MVSWNSRALIIQVALIGWFNKDMDIDDNGIEGFKDRATALPHNPDCGSRRVLPGLGSDLPEKKKTLSGTDL